MTTKTRREFTDEFKSEAVAQLAVGGRLRRLDGAGHPALVAHAIGGRRDMAVRDGAQARPRPFRQLRRRRPISRRRMPSSSASSTHADGAGCLKAIGIFRVSCRDEVPFHRAAYGTRPPPPLGNPGRGQARSVRLRRRLLRSRPHPFGHRLSHPRAGRKEGEPSPVSTKTGEDQRLGCRSCSRIRRRSFLASITTSCW